MAYDLRKEIESLRKRLQSIHELKETVDSPGWKKISELFTGEINRLMQEIYDKCKNPKKNEIEIRCKWMLAESLGRIFTAINGEIAKESLISDQIDDKNAVIARHEKTFEFQRL